MRDTAFQWIAQHGYAGIFSLLVFGIVGLPVPDEWLLIFSGYLVFKRTLSFIPTFAAAFFGSSCGITISYTLGRIFDTYVLVKYGSVVHITPARLARVHSWFERRGRWTLLVGYFIPGVRNLIGFTSGMMRLKVRIFAPFAYVGAIVSSLTCVALGYFLGSQASWVLAAAGRFGLLAIAAAAIFFIRKAIRNGKPEAVKTTPAAIAMSAILE